MANPDWTRDELILALDLYFREPSARGSKSHPGCIELSQVLNALSIHSQSNYENTFRNENGVGMKLSNFLKYDPTYKGKGLQSGSKLEAEVWESFAQDLPRLASVSKAIRAGISELNSTESDKFPSVDADEEAEEGRVLVVLHKKRERSAALSKKKKVQIMKVHGRLACEVCDFDFQSTFGDHGTGYAECHHDKPISQIEPGAKTKLSDLRIVCANCHRMLHRGKPWPSIEKLRAIISQEKPNHSMQRTAPLRSTAADFES
jgi:5-methylcytosine-specific restriction protein A